MIDDKWIANRAVEDETGCWVWRGAKTGHGYGVVGWREDGRRRQTTAHRYVWQQIHGPIPQGIVVCHRCDNPPCVRPDHLFLGTQRENLEDMTRKGRRVVGEQSHLARLTEDQILEIRRRYQRRAPGCRGNSATLAAEFGIRRDHVLQIVRGERWRHLAATP